MHQGTIFLLSSLDPLQRALAMKNTMPGDLTFRTGILTVMSQILIP